MPDARLIVTLKLRGPILTHSTGPGTSLLSSPFARTSQGYYYIAGSLIKGRLREAWNELESATGPFVENRSGLSIDQLLGEGSGNLANNELSTAPKRGRLRFEDFVDRTKRPGLHDQQGVRYRVKIDEARGSVTKGAYQVIEAPYAVGEEACFQGVISFRALDEDSVERIRHCVEVGLRWITNLGANCNVGFGRLLDVTVDKESGDESGETISATGAQRLQIEIRPTAPLCISKRPLADNLFESEAFIPGSVLKGSLASTWRTLRGDDPNGEISAGYDPSRQELCECFHLIRFLHAFPSEEPDQRRPVTPPLSLVKVDDDLYDVAVFQKPILIRKQGADKTADWVAPAFAVDWKDNSDVRRKFGWANPKRELRVRTAIDAVRRKAKDQQLFAYEMIVPDGLVWHSAVDLSGIRDSASRLIVEEQLTHLLAYGLHGLGKTKVSAMVMIQSAHITEASQSSCDPLVEPETREWFWFVTLQTAAILCDPQQVRILGLFEAYRQVWEQLSESSIELKHFFARETLSGGFYLYRRFMKTAEYYPYLLTDPGSVFKLAAANGRGSEARGHIEDWLAHGLRLPDWGVKRYARDGIPGDDWRNCPYLREGGYGEVAVNLEIHISNRPSETETERL